MTLEAPSSRSRRARSQESSAKVIGRIPRIATSIPVGAGQVDGLLKSEGAWISGSSVGREMKNPQVRGVPAERGNVRLIPDNEQLHISTRDRILKLVGIKV
jgi:hypothetical protein